MVRKLSHLWIITANEVNICRNILTSNTHLGIAIPLLNRSWLRKLRPAEAPGASAGRVLGHDLIHQVRRDAGVGQRIHWFYRGILILLTPLLDRPEKNIETI